MANKCFAKGCTNEATTEFCPECLMTGGIKPKDYINSQFENSFTYHAPKNDQPQRYEAIRDKAKELAHMIDELCPESREKSIAQTNLEQSVIWAKIRRSNQMERLIDYIKELEIRLLAKGETLPAMREDVVALLSEDDLPTRLEGSD
ncbi:hypothetical protein [Lysinibacillus sp. NPDC096212]|uniref:Acb2/Tad1 domain-containing protein n=1 Tax=Lysinibacillus sp. NPDC096212 TaxID=3364135 RepID=UPI0037FA4348